MSNQPTPGRCGRAVIGALTSKRRIERVDEAVRSENSCRRTSRALRRAPESRSPARTGSIRRRPSGRSCRRRASRRACARARRSLRSVRDFPRHEHRSIERAVARGEPPDVRSVARPLARIRRRVRALRNTSRGASSRSSRCPCRACTHPGCRGSRSRRASTDARTAARSRRAPAHRTSAHWYVLRTLPTQRAIDGMRRRAEGEDVEEHRLVESLPVCFDVSLFRRPSHAHERRGWRTTSSRRADRSNPHTRESMPRLRSCPSKYD